MKENILRNNGIQFIIAKRYDKWKNHGEISKL